MSLEALAWAARKGKADGLNQTTKIVLIAIADNVRRDNDSYPLSKTDIADFCLISTRSVQHALTELERLKLVERVPQYREDGSREKNLIRLNLAHPPSQPRSPPPENVAAPPGENHVPPLKNQDSSNVESYSSTLNQEEPEGADEQNPVLEFGAPLAKPRVKPKAKVAVAAIVDEAFERFWEAYPQRQGSNPRAPAAISFGKAVRAGTDPAAIIRGAENYAAEQARIDHVGTTYIAQAVTWLNQTRWGDYQRTPEPVREPFRALRV